jgi:hypothetical protein
MGFQRVDSTTRVSAAGPGVVSQYFGQRGWWIRVRGIWLASGLIGINSAEALLASYCDGIARPLLDNRGRTWPQVLLWTEPGAGSVVALAGGLVGLPYRCLFRSLL